MLQRILDQEQKCWQISSIGNQILINYQIMFKNRQN